LNTKRGRGRPKGSRDLVARHAPGMRISGAATSAAKMNGRPGVAPVSGLWLYVRGEGFVRWADIELEVEKAYLQWRRKKAMEGVFIRDCWEKRETDIAEAVALKSDSRALLIRSHRAAWLAAWQVKHYQLCEAADLIEYSNPGASWGISAATNKQAAARFAPSVYKFRAA